jgi:hypothetical protein
MKKRKMKNVQIMSKMNRRGLPRRPCNIFDKDEFPMLHLLGLKNSTLLD